MCQRWCDTGYFFSTLKLFPANLTKALQIPEEEKTISGGDVFLAGG